MGIQNKDGALYFATGIDNSGLYSGRQEAMGIIKAMAGEITSFDVFGGLGISAGIAFAKAAKDAYDFEKQFQQSMKEVATLSSGIKGSLTDYMNQVVELTREVPTYMECWIIACRKVMNILRNIMPGMMTCLSKHGKILLASIVVGRRFQVTSEAYSVRFMKWCTITM